MSPSTSGLGTGELEHVEDVSVPVPALAVIDGLFLLMKTIGLVGELHPSALDMARSASEAIHTSSPPFALQFIGDGVFFDRSLLPLDTERFERAMQLARAFDNLAAQELLFEEEIEPGAMLRLGVALARGWQGPSDEFETLRLAGLKWREIPHARRGLDTETVDPELAAIAQMALAVATAEQMLKKRGPSWSWSSAMSVVRRLERALVAEPSAAARALELSPEPWSIARRSVSAAHQALAVLSRLKVLAPTKRAVAHTALALCMEGLREREGLELQETARNLCQRMIEGPTHSRTGAPPQRIVVTTLVHQLARVHNPRAARLAVAGLLDLVYELERQRCPNGVSFSLTKLDLVASAALGMQSRFEPIWVRALIRDTGLIPPGACVKLQDGRIATVLEPGGDAPHIVVLVDGVRTTAPMPVQLVPPHSSRLAEGSC